MAPATPSLVEALVGAPRNWGRWGEADEIGALNFLDRREVLRGLRSATSGDVVPLGLEILRPGGDPAIAIRGQIKKFMSADKGFFANGHLQPMGGGQEYADDAVFMYLQASTHVDALGHVWYDDTLYNGYPASTTIGGLTRCSVKPIADHGIVGRGVLVDIPRHRGCTTLAANEQVTFAEFQAAAAAQGIEFQRHDIVLIRTGRITVFYEDGIDAFLGAGQPGITDEPELIRWFHEMEICGLGSDTVTAEQSISSVSGLRIPLHAALMTNLGMPFLELLWLEDLARACERAVRNSFLFVASPLRIHTATGSPLNPLAIL
jgi:kynurenine formamidase